MNVIQYLISKLFPFWIKPLQSELVKQLQKSPEEYKAEADAYIALAIKRAADATLDEFSLVKAIDLKAGDIIIHEYSRFVITECGCGYFAGNEFGDYFWIKGAFLHGNSTDPKPNKDFWSSQCCPMIRCKI